MPMTPNDILWFFFTLSALQPVLKQRLLEAARQRLIARIESQRDSRVILLVHRQETMSFLGFPVLRYIDVNDSEEVLRAIHLTDPNVPLDSVSTRPADWFWSLCKLRVRFTSTKEKSLPLSRTMRCPAGR